MNWFLLFNENIWDIFFEKEQKRKSARLQSLLRGFIDQLKSCMSVSQGLETTLWSYSIFGLEVEVLRQRQECIVERVLLMGACFLRRDDAFRKIYFQLDGKANELDEPRLKKS